jgi:TolB-like protein
MSQDRKETQIRAGRLELLPAERRAMLDGVVLVLGARADDVLSVLLENAGRVVTHADLLAKAWGGRHVDDNNLQVQIAALRKALGADAIATVAGQGYQLALSSSKLSASTPVVASRHGEPPSIAILPFASRSGLDEDDVFADGMVDDLVEALSQSVNVRVLSSAATVSFRKDTIADLPATAARLGVSYLLQGNVRRVAQVLRVAVQLVDGATGAILWSSRHECALDEMAAVQEQLVLGLAAQLDVQVLHEEMDRALRKPAAVSAWEATTRANAAFRQSNGDGLRMAIVEAARAIDIAPDYGPAQSMYALASCGLYYFASEDNPAEIRRIRSHIERAMSLDPHNPVVLGNCATTCCFIGEPQEALLLARRAAKLCPVMPPFFVLTTMGIAHTLLDQWDEAIATLDAGIRAAPFAHVMPSTHAWKANCHMRANQWEDAEACLDTSLAISPDFFWALWAKGVVRLRAGRVVEALDLMRRMRGVVPELTLPFIQCQIRRSFHGNPVAQEIERHLTTLWNDTAPGA